MNSMCTNGTDTEELRAKVQELQRIHRLTLDREQRILELKEQVNGLAHELGREAPYRSQEAELSSREGTGAYTEADSESVAVRPEEMPFAQLLDFEQLRELLEDFCDSVGIASAVIDLEGNILAAARWQRICTD